MIDAQPFERCHHPQASQVWQLVCRHQQALAKMLSQSQAESPEWLHLSWQRDQGRYGGGIRVCQNNTPLFHQASINVSQVHYPERPDKSLESATALSTILHPRHPQAPSLHLHVSWTDQKSGHHGWRLMADLNPSLINEDHRQRFHRALALAAGALLQEGLDQGDRYFYIPARKRHRGVIHFYLEDYHSDSFDHDCGFADRFLSHVTECYGALLAEVASNNVPVQPQDVQIQLAYHTLYLFQVLTLDRGTTSGLLVHADNDLGVMGSLPPLVDLDLLTSWLDLELLPSQQKPLLKAIIAAIGHRDADGHGVIDDQTRRSLAQSLRDFYQVNPAAKDYLARGDQRVPAAK